MLVKVMVWPFLWNSISRDAKFQVMLPMSANQGVPRITSMSLLMSTSRASMWNVLVSMRRGTLQEALRQVISVPLLTRIAVLIWRSNMSMILAKLMSMMLWVSMRMSIDEDAHASTEYDAVHEHCYPRTLGANHHHQAGVKS